MAELRDEFGNPIQLTDELGNPVQLTDEHGNPIHLTGVATPVGAEGAGGKLKDMFKKDEPIDFFKKEESSGLRHPPLMDKFDKSSPMKAKLDRSSSSSSSSSEEDDGLGGRRKKGLKQKLKEKLGKEREEVVAAPVIPPVAFPSSVPTAKVTTYPAEPLHEKKTMLEKIKEKLPGHHGHGH